MNAELRLTATDENDGTFMVTVTVRSGFFSGKGTACFGREELLTFALEIQGLVETLTGEPEVRGGNYSLTGGIETTLVALKLFAADQLGRLAVIVEVCSEAASNELVQQNQRSTLAFSTEPGLAETFARHLADVIRNEREIALLGGYSRAM